MLHFEGCALSTITTIGRTNLSFDQPPVFPTHCFLPLMQSGRAGCARIILWPTILLHFSPTSLTDRTRIEGSSEQVCPRCAPSSNHATCKLTSSFVASMRRKKMKSPAASDLPPPFAASVPPSLTLHNCRYCCYPAALTLESLPGTLLRGCV